MRIMPQVCEYYADDAQALNRVQPAELTVKHSKTELFLPCFAWGILTRAWQIAPPILYISNEPLKAMET